MNYFDVTFIVILLWSAYRGITRGLIFMAASLAALIVGIWGAIRFSDLTAALLADEFNLQSQYLGLIAFAFTFVAIVVAVHLMARVLDKLVKAVALGFMNRLFGLLFAVLKNAFVISVILVVLNTVDEKMHFLPREQVDQSVLFEPLANFAPMVFPCLNQVRPLTPSSLQARFLAVYCKELQFRSNFITNHTLV